MADGLELPRETLSDIRHQAVRTAVDVLTVGLGTLIFDNLVTPPIERRRDSWREEVGQRIQQLEGAGQVSIEALIQDEQFATTLLQASAVAIRTHEKEKINALRNAVLNAALPEPPAESIQQMFIAWIDGFTTWHLRLARFFQDPKAAFLALGKTPPIIAIVGNIPAVVQLLYPELGRRQDFAELVANDLHNKKIIEMPRYVFTGGADGIYCKRTTSLGDQLLGFISAPIQ
jgi:hypothetical protein